MSTFQSLKSHFLIAMPTLDDPNFHRSVTLICEHNEEGAMGIVINQPTEVTTSELLDHLEIAVQPGFHERPVLAGGPVQMDRGFVIHSGDKKWQSSLELDQQIKITTSQDILKALPHQPELNDAFVALGYAGWGPGQLEAELLADGWLTLPAEDQIIFDIPDDEKWRTAAMQYGIDISTFGDVIGYA